MSPVLITWVLGRLISGQGVSGRGLISGIKNSFQNRLIRNKLMLAIRVIKMRFPFNGL